jgi:starch synthase
VGAIPDMLDDGTGTVIHPRDGSAVAEALESVLSDPDAAGRMGELARVRAETEYAVEPVVSRYVALWSSLAGRPRRLAWQASGTLECG